MKVGGLLNTIFRKIYSHKDPAMIKRQYGLPDILNLNIGLTREGWFVVQSPDLPGLVTQAKDREELIEMVNDAVLTYFDIPRRDADIVYNQFNFGDQIIQYKGKLQTKAA
jgi:predicted RNase H-like HicB family nuclease